MQDCQMGQGVKSCTLYNILIYFTFESLDGPMFIPFTFILLGFISLFLIYYSLFFYVFITIRLSFHTRI